MTDSRNVKIEDYGNIDELEFDIPDRGCVIEVLGRCGSGKSVALNGVAALAGGKLEYQKRDGSEKAVIRGLEAQVSLRRSASRKGKIVCELLDEQSDIGDLVNPRIKDPDAASAKQIKALLRLSGAVIDEPAFQLCKAAIDIEGVTDPVLMAAKAKRQYEVMARKSEDNATTQQAYYDAAVGAAGELDMSAECDDATLQASFESALKTESMMSSQKEALVSQREKRGEARQRIDQVKDSYMGPSVVVLCNQMTSASIVCATADKRVERAKEELHEAETEAQDAKDSLKATGREHTTALEHGRVIKELTSILESESVRHPTEDEWTAAVLDVASCREEISRGVLIRDAKSKLEEAKKCKAGAKSCRAHAESYRKAAAGCDGVLSNSIDCDQLSVKNGHLVTEHEPYNRLSEGLRWKLAIEIACSHAPDGQSLLVIPQEEYQATDPDIRQMLRELAVEKNIVVLAGLATSGELHVKELEAVEV